MNDLERKDTLLAQQFDFIYTYLERSDEYKKHIQYFFNYLERESYKLSFNGFLAYWKYLNEEFDGGHFKVTTFNVRLCSAKRSITFLFEKSPYSTDMAKEFKLDRVLSSYKCKTKESKFVKKGTYLTPAEIREFIDKCPDTTISLLVEFIFKTACRISEVTNILLSDIKRINDHYEITIRGKGGKSRDIPVSVELVNKIKKHFKSKRYLFEHKYKGERGKYSSVSLTNRFNEYVHSVLKKDKETKFRCHTLRHSALTHLFRMSKDIKKTSLFAGHSSVMVTADLYVHGPFEYEELKEFYSGF